MSFPNRWLVVVVLPCMALACAAPMFQVGPAPSIPPAVAPPPLPNLRPVSEGPAETQIDVAQTKPLPHFGQSSLGFLGFELPSHAGVGDRRALIDQALTMGAINAGFKHIVDLGSASEILVALNEEKSANGVRSSTWWAGVMDQLAQIADVGRVDYILLGEFRNPQTRKQTRVTPLELPAEELTDYMTAYARFRAASAERILATTSIRQTYQNEFNHAKDVYESEKAQKTWWDRTWMVERDFKQRSAEYDSFMAAAESAIVATQASEQNVPTPERLAQENRGKTQQAQVTDSTVDLTVKLLEARTGQVVWAAHLWRTAPEESSTSTYSVVARLLDELNPHVPGKRRR